MSGAVVHLADDETSAVGGLHVAVEVESGHHAHGAAHIHFDAGHDALRRDHHVEADVAHLPGQGEEGGEESG